MTSLPIRIPSEYDLLVEKNDTVKAGQVLARKKHAPSEIIIEIAKRLKVSPKSVGKMLKKNPGDHVEIGDVLAKKDGLFGDVIVVSNISGMFATFDRSDGNLIIRLLEDKEGQHEVDEILCPLDGIVTLCHNEQIILETEKNVLLGENGTGQTYRGILKLSDAKSKDAISAEKITIETIGCVFLGPAFTKEAYAKASAIGVGGIITLSLDDGDIEYLSEKRLTLPVIQVSEEVGKSISRWKNKEVFMDGQNKTILLLSYEKSTR